MQSIENAYERVAQSFMNRDGLLTENESASVTDMYVLWNLRAAFRHAPQSPIQLRGVMGDQLSSDVLRRCDELCVVTVDSSGAIAAREIYGDQILQGMTHYRNALRKLRWVCKAFDGESIVVPDQFTAFAYLPLSPSRVFIDSRRGSLTGRELNNASVAEAKTYCFQFAPPGLMKNFRPQVSVQFV